MLGQRLPVCSDGPDRAGSRRVRAGPARTDAMGMSHSVSMRIGMLMQEHVDGGLLAGAIALRHRDGKVRHT